MNQGFCGPPPSAAVASWYACLPASYAERNCSFLLTPEPRWPRSAPSGGLLARLPEHDHARTSLTVTSAQEHVSPAWFRRRNVEHTEPRRRPPIPNPARNQSKLLLLLSDINQPSHSLLLIGW